MNNGNKGFIMSLKKDRIQIDDGFVDRFYHALKVRKKSRNAVCMASGMSTSIAHKIFTLKMQGTISIEILDKICRFLEVGRMWLETGNGSIDDTDYKFGDNANDNFADAKVFRSPEIFFKFKKSFFEDASELLIFECDNKNLENNTSLTRIYDGDKLIIKLTNSFEKGGIYLVQHQSNQNFASLKAIQYDASKNSEYPVVYHINDSGAFDVLDETKFKIIGKCIYVLSKA